MWLKINVLAVCFLFCCCGLKESPDYYQTEQGLRYKFHDVAVSQASPKLNDYVALNALVHDHLDSVVYKSSSFNESVDFFLMDSLNANALFQDGLGHLFVGDSVSFYFTADEFFSSYLNVPVPKGFSSTDSLLMSFRILGVSPSVFQIKKSFMSKESYFLDSVLTAWNNEYDSIHNYGLLNWVYKNQIGDSAISVDDDVNLSYSCYLANMQCVYKTDSGSWDVFTVGLEGQMIEGFDYLLQHLNYGDHVVALVPSFLGFKEKGGVGGVVPRNSPLLFELKIKE